MDLGDEGFANEVKSHFRPTLSTYEPVRFAENTNGAFEISRTQSLFVPVQEIAFSGTFAAEQEVGKLYVLCAPKTSYAGASSGKIEVEA